MTNTRRTSKRKNVKWPVHEEAKLIALIRARTNVWDHADPQFKNIQLRTENMEEICKVLVAEFGYKETFEYKTVVEKWHTMRDYFFKLCKTNNVTPTCEDGSEAVRRVRYIHFKSLLFLRNMIPQQTDRLLSNESQEENNETAYGEPEEDDHPDSESLADNDSVSSKESRNRTLKKPEVWEIAEESRLIELFHEHRHLWDFSCRHSSINTRRKDTLKRISGILRTEFGPDEKFKHNMIGYKFKRLKTYFLQLCRDKKIKSASSAEKLTKKNIWVHFKSLIFLLGEKSHSSTLQHSEPENETVANGHGANGGPSSPIFTESGCQPLSESENDVPLPSVEVQIHTHQPREQHKSLLSKREKETTNSARPTESSMSTLAFSVDEESAFAAMVASRLRNLPVAERTQMKLELTQILFRPIAQNDTLFFPDVTME